MWRHWPVWRRKPWAKIQCIAAPTCRSPSPYQAAAKRQENGVGVSGVCHHLQASRQRKPA